MSRCRPKNKALSLLELLIATAILSIGMVAVMRALSFSASATGISCDMVKAAFLAEDKIQEFESKEIRGLLVKEPATGSEKKGKYEIKYSLDFAPASNIYRLNCVVTWPRKNRKEELNLATTLRKL